MLQKIFVKLVSKYSTDANLIQSFWQEIELAYSDKSRHYHNLSHLENMYNQLSEVEDLIDDFEVVLFSLFYHDVVYNSSKKDNEERSADLARERMQILGVSEYRILKCVAQILETKGHSISEDKDTNFFTDADLSILGLDWDLYSEYAQNVRKEYNNYPTIIYKMGRRKVLRHFLEMERIFKTEYFFDKFEVSARENLKRELR